LQRQPAVVNGNFGNDFNIAAANTPLTADAVAQETDYLAVVSAYVNAHHNTIVLLWFVVICIKAVQMAAGLQTVYRLKRSGTQPAASLWPQRMQQMAQRLDIERKIDLLESALAKVPMVIGHFKPVILMPIGLLSALSTAEVEAILMHELAHIRRRDYLVNLLQSLVEVIFFFNPAVLWVSQLIKTERENCCDDIALAQTVNKHSYIQALVSCEEYQQGRATYTVAFSGQKGSLISRVKRMVTNRNHSLNTFEKTLLTVWLVVSGLCFSAFAEREHIKKTIHQVVKAITAKVDEPETAPIDPTPVDHTPIDPTPIDPAPIAEVPSDDIIQPIAAGPAIIAGPDTPKSVIRRTTITQKTFSTVTSNKLDLKKIRLQDSVDRFIPDTPVVYPAIPSHRALMDEMVKDGLITKEDALVRNGPAPYSIGERELRIKGVKQSDALARKYWLLRVGDPVQYAKAKAAESRLNHKGINNIILQMAKDKLINTSDEYLNFKLDNSAFIVNGVKQPDAIFQKYLNEFVTKASGAIMSWSFNNVIPK
jgi:bla regulator protein BlaR1